MLAAFSTYLLDCVNFFRTATEMLSKLRKATRAAGSKLDIRPKPVAKMEGLLALPGGE
jgi:hypothetical protein